MPIIQILLTKHKIADTSLHSHVRITIMFFFYVVGLQSTTPAIIGK